jgi:two-component system, sensor histidine kinase and response regulator
MQHAVTRDNAELSLLLVEDEEPARASLRRMLSLKFPELVIHTAENGLAGLELYRRCLPELVITDIRMPQLNGIEMAQAIRAMSPQAQIIVLSAHSDSRFRDDAANTGVARYLLKPVDGRELFAAVEGCLERSRHEPLHS